jgi:hypothetical protein
MTCLKGLSRIDIGSKLKHELCNKPFLETILGATIATSESTNNEIKEGTRVSASDSNIVSQLTNTIRSAEPIEAALLQPYAKPALPSEGR